MFNGVSVFTGDKEGADTDNLQEFGDQHSKYVQYTNVCCP